MRGCVIFHIFTFSRIFKAAKPLCWFSYYVKCSFKCVTMMSCRVLYSNCTDWESRARQLETRNQIHHNYHTNKHSSWLDQICFFRIVRYYSIFDLVGYNQVFYATYVVLSNSGRKTLNFFMYSILHFSNVFNDHLNIGNLNGYNPERPEEKKFRQWPFLLVSL